MRGRRCNQLFAARAQPSNCLVFVLGHVKDVLVVKALQSDGCNQPRMRFGEFGSIQIVKKQRAAQRRQDLLEITMYVHRSGQHSE